MKCWTSWLARLGLAGSCLVWAGCGGGSDIPDPDSDSRAAKESAPSSGGPPPAVAQAEETSTPTAAARPAPAAPSAAATAPEPASQGNEPVVATAVPPTSAEEGAAAAAAGEEKAAAKPDVPSATTEMLALANAPAAPAPAEGAEKAEAAPTGGPPPGVPGSAGMPGAFGGPGGMRPPGAPPGVNMPTASYPGASGAPGGPPPGVNIPGAPGAQGYGAQGMPGRTGPGNAEASAPASFRTPHEAVTSFLNALRAKDPERLAESTALRAGHPSETSPNYQKVFTSIIEQSLAPEDLDELAKKFDGMNIVGENEARSSARLGVIVGKSTNRGDMLSRTITVRKEKAGWKVVDISGQRDSKTSSSTSVRGSRGGR